MASRAEEKARRKQERLAREQERESGKRRKRLLGIVLGSVAAAVAVVGILIALSTGGGGSGKVKGASTVSSTLKGIEQDGPTLGDPDAPVTIVEYGDLQCPACKSFSDGTFPEVVKQLLKSGKAKMEMKLLRFLGPDSETAALAALAASKQNKLWDFVDLFYTNQGTENSGYVTDNFLKDIASSVSGLDVNQWEKDRADEKLSRELEANDEAASDAGVESTPTFILKGPGGEETVNGAVDYSQFLASVEKVSGTK